MTFISYAQNFEDIMLWRALKHVEKGFYIDVGANDPVLDSVTLAFYERGWRGINIEPMRQYFDQLRATRPDDINLPVAVGDAKGEFSFFDIPDTGLSTMDASIAQSHRSAGKEVVEQKVPVVTLADICAEHVRCPVHFLKIDVEGLEGSVLRGMDFQRWRPWILVIEATRPQSRITNHEEWESLVLDAGYRFAYFDGLNHFYVAADRPELMESFKLPPNVFDDFNLRVGHAFSYPLTEFQVRMHDLELNAYYADLRTQRAHAHRDELDAQLREMEGKLHQAEDKWHQAVESVNAEKARTAQVDASARETERVLRAELAAVYASTSWRVSAPVRWLGRATIAIRTRGRLAGESPQAFARRVLAGLLRRVFALARSSPLVLGLVHRIARLAKRHPSLSRLAFRFRDRFPDAWERLRRLLNPARALPSAMTPPPPAAMQSSIWSSENSTVSSFKTMLLQELQQRQRKNNGEK